MPHPFTGFPKGTFAFLSALQANNSKDWFDRNRDRYETFWKAPALDLVDAVQAPMAQLDPPLKAEARINGSLRRINRDVRFSKDKSPYQAQLHLIFWSGVHPNRSPGFHLVLQPDSIGYGAGVFGLAPADLAAYRNRIMDADERAKLLDAIQQAKAQGCDFDPPDLKRLPKGFEADGDWDHLLRRKGFVMRNQTPQPIPDWIQTEQCPERVMDLTRSLIPLLRWLQAAPGNPGHKMG